MDDTVPIGEVERAPKPEVPRHPKDLVRELLSGSSSSLSKCQGLRAKETWLPGKKSKGENRCSKTKASSKGNGQVVPLPRRSISANREGEVTNCQ